MNHYDASICMIERQIKQISASSYPSSELCEGMIEANYAHGFLTDQQREDMTDRALSAVRNRRTELHILSIAKRTAEYAASQVRRSAA